MEEIEVELLRKEIEQFAFYKNMYECIRSLTIEEGRKSIEAYIADKNIKKIVIYGASATGRILYDILEKITECEVVGIVDKGKTTEYGFHEFLSVEELERTEYDLIVITPLNAFKAIENYLKSVDIHKYCFVLEMADYVERKELYEDGLYF